MKRSILYPLLFLIFAGTALFSGYQLVTTLQEYKQGEDTYAQVQQFVSIPDPVPVSSEAPDPTAAATTAAETTSPDQPTQPPAEPDNTVWPVVDFDALHSVNEDVVAWVYIEGTNINYPVMQSDDNGYYLYRLIDGTENLSGSIFMDYRNEGDLSGIHTILYGHHMKNGTMFADLSGYKTQQYYDEHPVVLLMTPEKNYKVELFAGYVAKVDDNAWPLDFDSDEAFISWCQESKARSAFQCDVIPTAGEKLLTLSTCSYEFADARFVVVGVLR